MSSLAAAATRTLPGGHRSIGRWPILLVMSVTACAVQAPATPAAPPATASPAAATSPSIARSSPTPAAVARAPSPGIKTTAVSSVPREFVYIDTDPVTDVTLWLVDLSSTMPPTVVAQWTGGGDSFSASRDGTTVAIVARGARSPLALHLLRPLTGEATILYEGPRPDSRAFHARVSPDGHSVAFALSGETTWDGVWIHEIAAGRTRQLVKQPLGDTSPVYVIDWSDDSRFLTYSHYDPASRTQSGTSLFVHDVIDDSRVAVGTGHLVSWRAREPRLLLSHGTGKGNQGAYGAATYAYSLTSRTLDLLFSTDPAIRALAWNPLRDEFLYIEDTTSCPYRSSVWTRTLGGAVKRVGNTVAAKEAWWSADGSTIYALVRGSGQDADLIDTSSGRRIATVPNDVPALSCP